MKMFVASTAILGIIPVNETWAMNNDGMPLPQNMEGENATASSNNTINANSAHAQVQSHLVVEEINLKKLQDLIEEGTDVNNIRDKNGATLLQIAAYIDRKDIVQFLLDHHADINIRGMYGYTALHTAVLNNKKDMVLFLIEKGANVDIQSDDGSAPLHVAAHHTGWEMMTLLIERNANTTIKDQFGRTAFEVVLQRALPTLPNTKLNLLFW